MRVPRYPIFRFAPERYPLQPERRSVPFWVVVLAVACIATFVLHVAVTLLGK